jgi:hypothetical protein
MLYFSYSESNVNAPSSNLFYICINIILSYMRGTGIAQDTDKAMGER